VSRPKNPDSFWNRLDGGALLPEPAHVIEDIRMRPGEYWVRCTCGWYTEAHAPSGSFIVKHGPDGAEEVGHLPGDGLAEQYATHIDTMKRQPLLAGSI
jgi:hypothetical protein